MARAAREVVGVMDETTTKAAKRAGRARRPASSPPRRPWAGSTGRASRAGAPRAHLRAPLDPPGRPSLRRDHLGAPDRRHPERDGQERLRAEGRRGPQLLEPARDQRRRQQVLPRPHRHARARDQRQASSSTVSSTRSPPGRRPSATSRPTRTSQTFKAELTHLLVHQKMAFNSPVWFNVGIEARPQCSACFINSVQDNMGSIMDLAKTEAMLFKYGSGAGVNLSTIRGSQGADGRRRHRVGPGQLHEGLRRVRGRHQVGRQDPPRGQDGHPRRRSSGRPRLHRFQGERGEEGLGAHRAGLRPQLHRRGLRLGLLPERQPLASA